MSKRERVRDVTSVHMNGHSTHVHVVFCMDWVRHASSQGQAHAAHALVVSCIHSMEILESSNTNQNIMQWPHGCYHAMAAWMPCTFMPCTFMHAASFRTWILQPLPSLHEIPWDACDMSVGDSRNKHRHEILGIAYKPLCDGATCGGQADGHSSSTTNPRFPRLPCHRC